MSILVKNNIHWVGQRDWEVRDFHGTEYKTLRGSSYNSYLIREEDFITFNKVAFYDDPTNLRADFSDLERKRATRKFTFNIY